MKLVIGILFLSLTSVLATTWQTQGSSSYGTCAADMDGNVAHYWYDSMDYYTRYEFKVSTMLSAVACSTILMQVLNDKGGCWKTDFAYRTDGSYSYYYLAETQNGDESCPDYGSEYKSFQYQSGEPDQYTEYWTQADGSACDLCTSTDTPTPDSDEMSEVIQLCYDGYTCPAPAPVVNTLSETTAAAGTTTTLNFDGENIADDTDTLPYIKIIPSGGLCNVVEGTSDALGTWAAGQLSYSSDTAATFNLVVPSWYAATSGNKVCVSTESGGTYYDLAGGVDTIATTFTAATCYGEAGGCSHISNAISCTEDSHCVGVKPIGEANSGTEYGKTCQSFAHEFSTDSYTCNELLAFVVYGGGFCSSMGSAQFGMGLNEGMCVPNGGTWNALEFTSDSALLSSGNRCGICTTDLNTVSESGATAYQVTSSDAGYGGYTAPPPAPAPAPTPAPAPASNDLPISYEQVSTCRAAGWGSSFNGHTKYVQWWDDIAEFANLDPQPTGLVPLSVASSDAYVQACYNYHADAVGAENIVIITVTSQYCIMGLTDQVDSNCADTKTYGNIVVGPKPDLFEETDRESNPLPDLTWETRDVACGDNNFVSLATNGDFSCQPCGGDGTNSGQQLFLFEYEKIRKTGEGTGVLHGKCCINGHHKVCQQLLNSYKTKCTDDVADKGHSANRQCSA